MDRFRPWRSMLDDGIAPDEMGCGAPGVTRKRLEASDGVDASYRLLCTRRSIRDRAECHLAVSLLQLAKCLCALFELDYGLRLDGSRRIRAVWQSPDLTSDRGRVSHRLRAQLRRTHIVRAAGCRAQFAFLARDLGQTRGVLERMQCACEPILLLFRFGWAARLRHEFPRPSQGIAGLCYRDRILPNTDHCSLIRSRQCFAD